MTDLHFEVVDARTEPHAAVPTIMFRTRAEEADGKRVHAAALRCQIRIEPQRRRYSEREEEKLYELFGETPQWGNSLRPFLWTHVSSMVGRFDGTTEFDLPVECTYDFEVAGAKYMHALGDGDIPLIFLFSGTVFTQGASGFSAEPLSWSTESSYRLPVAVWRSTMDAYFPGSGFIRVRRDTLDDLQRFRATRGLPTWDQAFAQLLKEAEEGGHERDRHEIPQRPPQLGEDRFETARTVADAVLYEGYVLYPYRASSRKNQVRFQWGVLTPRAYSEADGSERWSARTECLVDLGGRRERHDPPRARPMPADPASQGRSPAERTAPRTSRARLRARRRPRGGRDVPRRVGRGGRPRRSTCLLSSSPRRHRRRRAAVPPRGRIRDRARPQGGRHTGRSLRP